MGKGSTETATTNIAPEMRAPSLDLLKALMMAGSKNPFDLEYTGPRMAAMNDAQKQAMDATAARGQALGLNFTSAANSLPASQKIDGMDVYDTLSLAKQNIPAELQKLYEALYGDTGPLGKHDPNKAAPQPQNPFANMFMQMPPSYYGRAR